MSVTIETIDNPKKLPFESMRFFSLASEAEAAAKEENQEVVYYFPKNTTYYVPVNKLEKYGYTCRKYPAKPRAAANAV